MDKLPESVGENLDESLLKCEFIGSIVPTVCQSIKDLQAMTCFENNLELTMATQYFNSLKPVGSLNNSTEKLNYITTYREHLTLGLTKLAEFFNGLMNKPLPLTDQQKTDFSNLATIIITSQHSIEQIASY
jgi:hypothetical protein